MTEESEILKKLLVEEKDMTKELEKQVEEASKHFRIEKPSGRILFKDFGALRDKQRIAVLLLGKYFACQLKLIEDPSLSMSEISRELVRPMTTLSKYVGELVDAGYIESLPATRKYRVSYHRIPEIFSSVLTTKTKK
jgi:hypothetical protein